MAKKAAKAKHAPLKPRTAWAVVNNKTGVIGHGYTTCAKARREKSDDERVERVRITKA